MPIVICINALAVLLGGCLGALARNRIGKAFRKKMALTMGCCAMTIGITGIVAMENMTAVILSVTIGTSLGLAIGLGGAIRRAAGWVQGCLPHRMAGSDSEGLLGAIVLFCASGTGIYGSLVYGMTGEPGILLTKSVLDLFTAAILACDLGWSVSLVSLPQLLFYLMLYLLATPIAKGATAAMLADFKAVGGVIMLATGLKIAEVGSFPVADMLPAMVLAFPISSLWSQLAQPWLLSLFPG